MGADGAQNPSDGLTAASETELLRPLLDLNTDCAILEDDPFQGQGLVAPIVRPVLGEAADRLNKVQRGPVGSRSQPGQRHCKTDCPSEEVFALWPA